MQMHSSLMYVLKMFGLLLQCWNKPTIFKGEKKKKKEIYSQHFK